MITLAGLEHDVLIVASAVSAGIHIALTPEHVGEGIGAGAGFLAAGVLLAALVVALTSRPASTAAVTGAAVVLAGLLASYALATTSGLPLLHPDAEPVESLALVTKAIEAVGLLAAVHLLLRGLRAVATTNLQPKGRLT